MNTKVINSKRENPMKFKKVLLITAFLGLSACCGNSTAADNEERVTYTGSIETVCGLLEVKLQQDENGLHHLVLSQVEGEKLIELDDAVLGRGLKEKGDGSAGLEIDSKIKQGISYMNKYTVSSVKIDDGVATGIVTFKNNSCGGLDEQKTYSFELTKSTIES
jgi:hypothetical protein